jgi:hypothetical protein
VLAVGSLLPLSFSVPPSSAEARANLPDRRKQAEGSLLSLTTGLRLRAEDEHSTSPSKAEAAVHLIHRGRLIGHVGTDLTLDQLDSASDPLAPGQSYRARDVNAQENARQITVRQLQQGSFPVSVLPGKTSKKG